VTYEEPILTVCVLDMAKPIESYMCLTSIKKHIKFSHHVIFCDNGSGEDYAAQYVKEGLVDQLIINRDSRGLGLGTRDLMSLAAGEYTLYLQNDQVLARDFWHHEFFELVKCLGGRVQTKDGLREVMSISLAGYPCGEGIYSERAHIIRTKDYKAMEPALGYHGAGPFHNGVWREAQIQNIYKGRYTHLAWQPIVQDNGVFAVRDMKDGGYWVHRTDLKTLTCIIPPTVKDPAYPKLTDEEFTIAARGEWPDKRIPVAEIKDSFDCWSNTMLGQMENEYIKDLRRRVKAKLTPLRLPIIDMSDIIAELKKDPPKRSSPNR